MQLPSKGRSGVQSLGQVPSGAAMGAAQAKMGEAKALGQMGQQMGKAVTDIANIKINRNLDKNISKLSSYSAQLEAEGASKKLVDASTLPDEVVSGIVGGAFEDVTGEDGKVTQQGKMIPYALVAPELNKHLRDQEALRLSKEIGSDVHATKFVQKANESANALYIRDSLVKGAELKRIYLNETVNSIDKQAREGEHFSAITMVEMNTTMPPDMKPNLIEKLKVGGLVYATNEIISADNLEAMEAESMRLGIEGNRDNGKLYDETDDLNVRAKQRSKLDTAIRLHKSKSEAEKKVNYDMLLDSANDMTRVGNHVGAITEIMQHPDLPDNVKPELIENVKQDALVHSTDLLIQNGDLAAMTMEYERLSDKDDRNNNSLMDETDDQSVRLRERNRLGNAINTRKSAGTAKKKGEFLDWLKGAEEGDVDLDDSYIKDLASQLGMEIEWVNARAYGKAKLAYGNASALDAKELEAGSEVAIKGREGYRKKAAAKKGFDDSVAEREVAFKTDGDKASYSIKYNELVSSRYDSFIANMVNPQEGVSAALFSMYSDSVKGDLIRKGVQLDNITLIPHDSPVIDYVNTALEKGSPSEKMAAVQKIGKVFGQDAGVVALEIADDVPAFAGALFTYKDDPVAAETMLGGYGKENTISTAEFVDEFSRINSGIQLGKSSESMRASVDALYLGMATGEDLATFNSELYKTAHTRLTGGNMVTPSGTQTISFRKDNGVFATQAEFNSAFGNTNARTLALSGQEPMYIGGVEFPPKDIMDIAIRVPAGNGKYALEILGSSSDPDDITGTKASPGHVKYANGDTYIFDANAMHNTNMEREATVTETIEVMESEAARVRMEKITAKKELERLERERIIRNEPK